MSATRKEKCLVCHEPRPIVAGGRCLDCLDVDSANGGQRQYMNKQTKKMTRPFKGNQNKLPGETNAAMQKRLLNEGEARAIRQAMRELKK